MKKNYNSQIGFVFFKNTSCSNTPNSNKLVLLFLLFFAFSSAFGQGATCATSTTLTVNAAAVAGIVTDTTINDPAIAIGCFGSATSRDGWYSFVATTSNATIIVVSNNRQLVLYGYSGTCGSLTQINCANSNTSAGGQTENMFLTGLIVTNTYYIRVVNATNNTMNLNAVRVTDQLIVPIIGSSSYTTCSGNLYDNGGSIANYATNSDGYTVLNPSAPGSFIRVSGSITSEAGYDYLTIYDGVGTGGAILWGGSPHGTGTTCTTFTIPTSTSSTGPLTVRFESDGSANCSGFNLAVSCFIPVPPTIMSLGATSGCVGSSLVITGTNLTSATAVTIGGTAATISANTSTSITAIIGAGTTGTVRVTTAGGNFTFGTTFTVNQLPTNPGNPTSNSPQCNPSGVTLTRAGTPPAGITWFWQTAALGTSIANNGATFVVNVSGTYYIRARNNITGCWSIGSGSRVVTVNPIITAIAGTPTPANNATGICFAGVSSVSSISWSNVAGSSSYDVFFGAGILPVTITANVATTIYNTGVLLANTTYFWRIVPRNACGITTGTPVTWSFTTTSTPCVCTPTSQGPQYVYINDVRFMGTLNDVDNLNSGFTNGYQNFTSRPKAIQAQGEGINVYYNNFSYTGSASVKAWVDWNKNGVFNTGEIVYNTGNISTSSASFGFVIPPSTLPGDYRIRIRNNITWVPFIGTTPYNFNPCENFSYTFSQEYDGEAEDYLFTVIASCNANIVSVSEGENCGPGTVALTVTGTASATGYNWYSTTTGATLVASTTSGSWTTPSLTTTTTYWVTATNASCESLVRTKITAEIKPLPTLTFTPNAPVICGDNSVLQLTAVGDLETVNLINENFESGGLGVFSNINDSPNGAPYDAITVWQNEISPYLPTNTQVWSPAISSGIGGNRFVMSTSDVNPPGNVRQFLSLTTPVNANTVMGLTLDFDIYYSNFADAVVIQANSGSGWTNIETYTASIGIGTRFTKQTIDLSAYNNSTSLRIRFQFLSGWGDGVAIDNVKLFGTKPLTTSFNYDTSTVDAFTAASCAPGTEYTSGDFASTVYIRPTLTQLENSNFTIPVSTTLSNGCSVSGSVVVVNNSKIFRNPTFSTNWNNPINWKPSGVPTAGNCVIIANDTDVTGTNYQAFARTLRVESTGNLNLGPSNFLTVSEKVTVAPSGIFDIENNGSLVQIDNIINEGSITYKRSATGIKGGDYVYWSSPVLNQQLNTIYSSPTSGPKYKWNTILNNGNGNFGNISQGRWVNANGNTMEVGKGYIVRGSNSASAPAVTINSKFSGIPNNGTIPITINRGQYTGAPYAGTNGTQITNLDDNWNLIGNPYPSAINALQFLFDNSTQILGNVRLWTHGSDIALNNGTTITNPFYGTFAYNYTSSDYLFINYLGTTIPAASDLVKTGQGFFVQMVDGAGNSTGTVNFNNGQRRNTYANNNFFRTTSENQSPETDNLVPERHRLWLDIVNSNNNSITTLVGYASGATNEKDSPFDAHEKFSGNLGIYSMIENETYAIQGRALPFDINDEIPIGFNAQTAGSYHIAILTFDGLFEQEAIYLKDELLNVYHDLKIAPYHFTTAAGFFANRFKIVYQSQTLDIPEFNNNNVVVYKDKSKDIQISTGNYSMAKVKVHDSSGRLLIEKNEINSNQLSIENLKNIADQVLLVTITTTENKIITKKVF